MDFFTALEALIGAQTPSSTASSVLAELGSPSVSIGILDHGHITSRCISMHTTGTQAHDEETLFQACSISKPITGLATMRLIQAGKLSLDSKIAPLLPARVLGILETPETRTLLPHITVRHLLSHTAGFMLSHFSGYADPAATPDIETVLRGAAPANTLRVKVQGLPGYAMSYSGGGMVVLQILLESVTGKDFGTLMKELVLQPLGMERSFFSLPRDGHGAGGNVAEAHRTGYTPCDAKWHEMPEKAAAGLWTTPTDLLKAVRGVQRSLRGESGQEGGEEVFLEREIAREMLREVKGSMALTWMAPQDPGIAFLHSGSNDPGWQCFVMGYADLKKLGSGSEQDEGEVEGLLLPEEDCGICIMTNSSLGSDVWTKVFHAITYLKGWAPLPAIPGGSPFGKIPLCAYDVKLDMRWVDWEGSWRDDEMGEVLVLEANEGGHPVLRFGEDIRATLVPAATPSVKYPGDRKSIDLVLSGLEMMARLGWKDGYRNIEVWYDGLPPKCLHLSRVE